MGTVFEEPIDGIFRDNVRTPFEGFFLGEAFFFFRLRFLPLFQFRFVLGFGRLNRLFGLFPGGTCLGVFFLTFCFLISGFAFGSGGRLRLGGRFGGRGRGWS